MEMSASVAMDRGAATRTKHLNRLGLGLKAKSVIHIAERSDGRANPFRSGFNVPVRDVRVS